jgi:hypothetical protein
VCKKAMGLLPMSSSRSVSTVSRSAVCPVAGQKAIEALVSGWCRCRRRHEQPRAAVGKVSARRKWLGADSVAPVSGKCLPPAPVTGMLTLNRCQSVAGARCGSASVKAAVKETHHQCTTKESAAVACFRLCNSRIVRGFADVNFSSSTDQICMHKARMSHLTS